MTGAQERAGGIPGPLPRAGSTHLPRFFCHIDPAVLRELAWLVEHRSGQRRVFVDPKRAAGELAAILDRGGTPTIGWWARNLGVRDSAGDPLDHGAGPP